MKSEVTELDETRMTAESRQFAAKLFSRFPELKPYAEMERAFGDPEWSLVVTVPVDVDSLESDVGPPNKRMQLTKPAQAMELRS